MKGDLFLPRESVPFLSAHFRWNRLLRRRQWRYTFSLLDRIRRDFFLFPLDTSPSSDATFTGVLRSVSDQVDEFLPLTR